MPGEGPTWISGLTVLEDASGRERMFAFYAKIRKMLEVYERGLAEFNPENATVRESRRSFPSRSNLLPANIPTVIRFLHQDDGINYVYYANPYPLLRVPADPERLKDPDGVRGLYLPGTGHAASPAAARPRPGRPAALRLEEAARSSSGRINRPS